MDRARSEAFEETLFQACLRWRALSQYGGVWNTLHLRVFRRPARCVCCQASEVIHRILGTEKGRKLKAMTTLKQLLARNTSAFLLLLGSLMLATSISSAADETIAITPTCDGLACVDGDDCGSKCVCNINGNLCLDITQIE
jgi:hypothetical protein